jgi:hypothetical protein
VSEDVQELPMHTAAVTVIVRAPGVDARDAARRVERALRSRLTEPLVDDNRTGLQMPVLDVMETGMAVGNGYLWLTVTSKAEREAL